MEAIADAINVLGQFLGKRDVKDLTEPCLMEKYHIAQADVMVLFGGSIIAGGDVLAEAIQNHIAQKYLIVGGEGHTTETLRRKVHEEYPQIFTEGLAEAEVFAKYLDVCYHLSVDALETKSTNCGNNITYLLDLLQSVMPECKSIILCQDAAMQCRMDAGLRKYKPDHLTIMNYASYQARVIAEGEKLVYQNPIHGMWSIDRYVQLLMGEIPRLMDCPGGYGPLGKGFIAHVTIPEEVQGAFEKLIKHYGNKTRKANPLYATK